MLTMPNRSLTVDKRVAMVTTVLTTGLLFMSMMVGVILYVSGIASRLDRQIATSAQFRQSCIEERVHVRQELQDLRAMLRQLLLRGNGGATVKPKFVPPMYEQLLKASNEKPKPSPERKSQCAEWALLDSSKVYKRRLLI